MVIMGCAILWLSAYVGLQGMVIGRVKAMEEENSIAVLNGVTSNLEVQGDALLRNCRDWSSWDATYTFMGGINPNYVENELTNSTLDNLDLRLFILLDNDNHVFFVKSYGDEKWTKTAIDEITSSNQFIPDSDQWRKAGYVSISGVNMLVVANPVLTSNDVGPSAGTLIWARQISNESLSDLASAGSHVLMSLHDSLDTSPSSIHEVSDSQLLSTVVVEPTTPGFDNVDVTAVFPRTYYQNSVVAVNEFLIVFGAMVVIIAIALYKVLDSRLLGSIKEIDSQLESLDPDGVLKPIVYERNNELNPLVDVVNGLFGEIDKYKAKLKENERLAGIGQTASMVGHDLRNPLQTVTLASYLLRRRFLGEGQKLESSDAEAMKSQLDTLDSQIFYMNKIVTDIQTYSQDANPKLGSFNILDVAREVVSSLTVPLNVKVSVEDNPSLPMVEVDSLMMKRVFTNLMLNGIQAMPGGGSLTVFAEENANEVVVSIRDTGVGIVEPDLVKLFTPFRTTKSKGMGLGLVAAKRIVEAHNGELRVESEMGVGTRFYFSLPLKKDLEVGTLSHN
jgi:signal transduction histidine kinase